jgi:hypothetical protein
VYDRTIGASNKTKQPPGGEAVLAGRRLNSAVDDKQDTRDQSTDPADKGKGKSGEFDLQKHQAFQEQEDPEQDPFHSTHIHFDVSF